MGIQRKCLDAMLYSVTQHYVMCIQEIYIWKYHMDIQEIYIWEYSVSV